MEHAQTQIPQLAYCDDCGFIINPLHDCDRGMVAISGIDEESARFANHLLRCNGCAECEYEK